MQTNSTIAGGQKFTSEARRNRDPSEEEIEQAKKLIQEVATTMKNNPIRLAVNRPKQGGQQQQQPSAFGAHSIERQAADATSQFGLNFLRSFSASGNTSQQQQQQAAGKNLVFSPLSLQELFSMLMLGSNGATELELAQVLGYQASGMLQQQADEATAARWPGPLGRMAPHRALHSVLDSIMQATRFSEQAHNEQASASHESDQERRENGDLSALSSKSDDSQQTFAGTTQTTPIPREANLQAHLQTNELNSSQPLSGQVNFTLANLMLTNKELVELDANFELDLRNLYHVQMEHFSSGLDRSKSGEKINAASSSSDRKPLFERVNEWVKNATQNQIDQLVKRGDLGDEPEAGRPSSLAMVLLNAAHFKGRWLHTFAPKATQPQPFYGRDGRELEVPFMRQKGDFAYAEFGGQSWSSSSSSSGSKLGLADEDAETVLTEDKEQQASSAPSTDNSTQLEAASGGGGGGGVANNLRQLNCSAISLPFSLNEGHELDMVILLPNSRNGLEQMLSKLDHKLLNEIYGSLQEPQATQRVHVELPKFALETTVDEAKEQLERLGLRRVFDANRADFGPMLAPTAGQSSGGRLKVDKVVHKARVMVDESGAEAAAASAVSIDMRAFYKPPPVFQANRPFVFVIRHARSNMPLFMGQLNSLG